MAERRPPPDPGPEGSQPLDYDRVALGERIRQVRGLRNMRLADVVAEGLSLQFLSQVERGEIRLTRPRLETIADRLGVTVAEILEGLPTIEDARRARALCQLAKVALNLNQPDEALAVLDQMPPSLPARLLTEAAICRAGAMLARGQLDGVLDVVKAIPPAAVSRQPRLAVGVALIVAQCLLAQGRPRHALDRLKRVERQADHDTLDPIMRASYFRVRAGCRMALQDRDGASEDLHQSFVGFAGARSSTDVVAALARRGRDLLGLGEAAAAEAILDQAAAMSLVYYGTRALARGHMALGDDHLNARSDPRAAAAEYAAAADLSLSAGLHGEQVVALVEQAGAALSAGEVAEAVLLARQAQAGAARHQSPPMVLGRIAWIVAKLRSAEGDGAGETAALLDAVGHLEAAGPGGSGLLARVCVRLSELIRDRGDSEGALNWALRGGSLWVEGQAPSGGLRPWSWTSPISLGGAGASVLPPPEDRPGEIVDPGPEPPPGEGSELGDR